jgi:hypothetical protein
MHESTDQESVSRVQWWHTTEDAPLPSPPVLRVRGSQTIISRCGMLCASIIILATITSVRFLIFGFNYTLCT